MAFKRVIGRCYFGGKEMFWNEIEVVVAQHCECSGFHLMVHLKLVNFLLYLFHFKLFIRKKKAVKVNLMEKVRSVQKAEGGEGVNPEDVFSPEEGR